MSSISWQAWRAQLSIELFWGSYIKTGVVEIVQWVECTLVLYALIQGQFFATLMVPRNDS